jgi:recombinational DNA repair protein (RecF pathway)
MECCKCGTDLIIDGFYTYEGETYCFDCLMDVMGIEIYTTEHYTKDGEYLGDEYDIVHVLQDYGVTEIESE